MSVLDFLGTFSAVTLGLVVGRLLPSYFSKKGENLATKEDVADITSRIETVRSQHAQALDVAREELKRHSSIDEFARATLSAAHTASAERRVAAVDALWEAMCQASRPAHNLLFFVDILSPTETKTNPRFREAVSSLELEAALKNIVDTTPLERHRPYCGDRIWALVYVATNLPGRVLAFYSLSDHQDPASVWTEDKMVRDFLHMVLDSEEIAAFDNAQVSLLTRLHAMFQQKFLALASDLISGKTVAAVALNHARDLQVMVAAEASNRALQRTAEDGRR